MPRPEKANGGSGSSASEVSQAEAAAEKHGLPGYGVWRLELERRHTVMPHWYWDELACRRQYISHIRAVIDWQNRERRISSGATSLQQSLVQHL